MVPNWEIGEQLRFGRAIAALEENRLELGGQKLPNGTSEEQVFAYIILTDLLLKTNGWSCNGYTASLVFFRLDNAFSTRPIFLLPLCERNTVILTGSQEKQRVLGL